MNNKYVKAFLGIALLSMSLTSCGLTGTANSKRHTVTFDTSGGTYIEPQKIKHGEKVSKPDDPEREGYSFIKWLFNDEEWSFIGYVVTEDMTITASWSANSYTLTLDVPASDIVIGNTATGG